MRQDVYYNEHTGQFFRLTSYHATANIDKPIGCKDKTTGYLRFHVNGKRYYAHRLAFLYMTGVMPGRSQFIDHKNGNKIDNRFINLRLASNKQNQANSKLTKTSKSGVKGVSKRGNRYRAKIMVDGTTITLGSFSTAYEAANAYDDAATRYFGEYALTNKKMGLI